MQLTKVVQMPALWFGRTKVMDEQAEWRVVLNKREYETLKRAAAILEEMSDLAAGDNPFGPEVLYDEVPGGDVLRCAESYLGEFVAGGADIGVTRFVQT